MLKFNERIMTKASAKSPFLLDDDDETHCGIFASNYGEPGDMVEIEVNEELWILNDCICDSYNVSKMVFAYFPRIDYATPIRDDLINRHQ